MFSDISTLRGQPPHSDIQGISGDVQAGKYQRFIVGLLPNNIHLVYVLEMLILKIRLIQQSHLPSSPLVLIPLCMILPSRSIPHPE